MTSGSTRIDSHVNRPQVTETRRGPAVGVGLRCATIHDAQTIAEHRRLMFRDMGYQGEERLRSMTAEFVSWVEPKMTSGDYLAWLAVTAADIVVAGAGLWLMDWPPHMLGSSPRRGNIVNVYTQPDYRGRGLARWLIEAAVHWCKVNQVDVVVLHASAEARRLYEAVGFRHSNEMRLTF
jgi:GNAT superfamily N-acetyltransferase